MLTNWNILIWEYEFQEPYWLILLLVVPILVYFLIQRENQTKGTFKFSRLEAEQNSLEDKRIIKIRKAIWITYGLIIGLLILALAKPFSWNDNDNFEEQYKNGIDIVLAIDASSSMLARDFHPNRMEASKAVAKKFIEGRKGDRIGLVVYSGEAYTSCPSTLDYDVVNRQIDEIGKVNLEGGTAIGVGLGTAVNRLRNDSIPSKVVILLTDGSNTTGQISPLAAAKLAKAKNVCVYTIGVGTNGEALSPVITPFGMDYEYAPVEIDEVTLKEIASITGGKYFRATDENKLLEIYQIIDKMEKRKMKERNFKSEPPSNPSAFLNWACLLLLLTWGVQWKLFRSND